MSFADEIKTLAGHVPGRVENLKTEEATKAALIQPFIRTLGYDVSDPLEVVPEFIADVDPKRVDRVDYAIMKDGKPIMLIECKPASSKLDRDEKWSQLFTYFIATEAKFGILTNGVVYQFFSDLDQRNKMDKKPFLELNLLNPIDDSLIQDLQKFTKQDFDPQINWRAARELKYTREIRRILSDQLSDPSDEFIKFLVSQMDLDTRMTKAFRQRFFPLTRLAFSQFITDQAYIRLKSAPGNGNVVSTRKEANPDDVVTVEDPPAPPTQDELQGYFIIKSLLRDVVDVKRVGIRDYKGFCGVLLDENQLKPICRLRFNSSKKKYLGLINAQRREERVLIEDLDDIYRYAERLNATVGYYV